MRPPLWRKSLFKWQQASSSSETWRQKEGPKHPSSVEGKEMAPLNSTDGWGVRALSGERKLGGFITSPPALNERPKQVLDQKRKWYKGILEAQEQESRRGDTQCPGQKVTTIQLLFLHSTCLTLFSNFQAQKHSCMIFNDVGTFC